MSHKATVAECGCNNCTSGVPEHCEAGPEWKERALAAMLVRVATEREELRADLAEVRRQRDKAERITGERGEALDAIEGERDALRALATKAIDLAAEAIPYAGEYFDDKWALSEQLAEIHSCAAEQRVADLETDLAEARALAVAEHAAFQTMNDRRGIAEADRDARLRDWTIAHQAAGLWQSRTERAEAERDALCEDVSAYRRDFELMRARLRAVEALCDENDAADDDTPYLMTDAIRAALGGTDR